MTLYWGWKKVNKKNAVGSVDKTRNAFSVDLQESFGSNRLC